MKQYKMKINGQNYEAQVVEFNHNNAKLIVNGVDFVVEFNNDDLTNKPQVIQIDRTIPSVPEMKTASSSVANDIKAPIPGVVISILKNEGDRVKTGDILLTLEAMKMESEILAPNDGTIEKIYIKEKSPVQEGDILVKIATDATTQAISHKPKANTSSAPAPVQTQVSTGKKEIKAPLPGTILDIKVNVGQKIQNNQAVIILEAMKMESEIFSDSSGTVKNILVSKGQSVQDGQVLIEFE